MVKPALSVFTAHWLGPCGPASGIRGAFWRDEEQCGPEHGDFGPGKEGMGSCTEGSCARRPAPDSEGALNRIWSPQDALAAGASPRASSRPKSALPGRAKSSPRVLALSPITSRVVRIAFGRFTPVSIFNRAEGGKQALQRIKSHRTGNQGTCVCHDSPTRKTCLYYRQWWVSLYTGFKKFLTRE
jgi:hypothetical protein